MKILCIYGGAIERCYLSFDNGNEIIDGSFGLGRLDCFAHSPENGTDGDFSTMDMSHNSTGCFSNRHTCKWIK